MMELTDDNMKYLALGAVSLFAVYMLYKSQDINRRLIEGMVSKGRPNSYASALKALPMQIKGLQKMLNVQQSRTDIEDILTDLSEMVDLAQINTLLNYADGKMDDSATQKVGANIRSFNDIAKAIKSSMEYLDKV